jgi:2-amino-4-hydroxy-6-hydroxymethyldihydropteridine diphosphokinase
LERHDSYRNHVRVQSNVYETEPWGYADQPAFLNMVVEAETSLEPEALLSFSKKSKKAWGARQPSKTVRV